VHSYIYRRPGELARIDWIKGKTTRVSLFFFLQNRERSVVPFPKLEINFRSDNPVKV
jgi:hypothetical protein